MYQWADGSIIDYLGWAPGEPGDQNNENCATIGFLEDGNEGKWYTGECRELVRPICQAYMNQGQSLKCVLKFFAQKYKFSAKIEILNEILVKKIAKNIATANYLKL